MRRSLTRAWIDDPVSAVLVHDHMAAIEFNNDHVRVDKNRDPNGPGGNAAYYTTRPVEAHTSTGGDDRPAKRMRIGNFAFDLGFIDG